MAALRFVDTLQTGIDAYDDALADLEVIATPRGPVLAAATGSGGGLITYTLGDAGAALADITNISASLQAGQRPQLVDLGGERVLVTGAQGDSVTRFAIDGAGAMDNFVKQGGISGSVQSSKAALLNGTALALAGPNQASTSLYTLSGDGSLQNAVTLPDTPATHAADVSALAMGSGATANVMITGSASEYGVTAYVVNENLFTAGDSIGPQDGLGIMVPTDIAMLEINGQSFAIVASAAGSVGGAGALSVLSVAPNGALTPTDHLLDTRDSRFGQAQCVEAVEIEGRGYVVAGGGDHGLSLLTLTPEGQLVHLQSIEDTPTLGLAGATDIELVVNGDRLEVFVITEEDVGIAHFRVDLPNLGASVTALDTGDTRDGTTGDDMMIGGAGRDNLSGGDGEDILLDGAEDDRLTGGNGADLFVLVQDGTRDTITDFDPSSDKIDLSAWSFLYDTTQLTIEDRGGHTRVTFRDERLDVSSGTDAPIDPDALRAAIVLDVNRSFLPPSVTTLGDTSAETLTGTWGADTLMGLGGDDTIEGLQGDDSLHGGGGSDTVILNSLSAEATIIELGGGAFEIQTSEGVDYVRAFEAFAFRDTTLTLDEMQARAIPDPGRVGVVNFGSTDDDQITGADFNDTLLGAEGHDVLGGKNGHDSLDGGDGNDTIKGNSGNDSLQGGDDHDRLSGGAGDDVLDGGSGRNRLSGQSGDDSLYGGEARDILNGGSGADEAWGLGGNDRMVGGRGTDLFMGGAGPDKLYGNADDDRLEGGADDDLLNGGGGSDTLFGGAGNDYLKGGNGGDIFVYALGDARDRIVDFDPTQDIILLSQEIHDPYESAHDLLDDLAQITDDGILLDFDGEDQLMLSDVTDLSVLAEAIHFA